MPLATEVRGYGVALLVSATATLLALLLRPYLSYSRLALFVAAVTLSAQVGGLGPGLLATLLGALAIDLIFLEPSGSPFVYPYPSSLDYLRKTDAAGWPKLARARQRTVSRVRFTSAVDRPSTRTIQPAA